MNNPPRVAFFADSFHDINGAAHTSRKLDAFARRTGKPFLCVHCGPNDRLDCDGSNWTLQLKRGRWAFSLDDGLAFDPLLFLRRRELLETLLAFKPDLIHVTGPGDVGILGAWAAHSLQIPLIASWHTNLHEFAARRTEALLAPLPLSWKKSAAAFTERWSLRIVLWFYSLARATLAPNQELMKLIGDNTSKPVFPMARGIDMDAFSPVHRTRREGPVTLGYVGRLRPEKNVRFLASLEKALVERNAGPFRLLIVGDGSERQWLEQNPRHAEFTGVLTGRELSQAYANMDAFVFPSQTDTFGNVILEAMASGAPAIVTASGGPKYLIADNVSGFVTDSEQTFFDKAQLLIEDRNLLDFMRHEAREHSRQFSWDRVFEAEVYTAYRICLAHTNQPETEPVAPAQLNSSSNRTFTMQ